MTIPVGVYRFGPDNADLSVLTGRTGAAAKAGHDIHFAVAAWKATLEVADEPAGTTLELTADGASLQVLEGTGGMTSLGDDDKADIRKSIDEDVLKRQAITFRSTSVGASDSGLRIAGELTLRGTTAPVAFDVLVDNGRLRAVAVVKQTAWGIKPYSTLFGALKVADEVEVRLDAPAPG